jgi:serine protease
VAPACLCARYQPSGAPDARKPHMPLLRSRLLSASASLAAAALLGAALAPVSASAAADPGEAVVVDRFIVKFADDAGRTASVRAGVYEQPADELGTEVQEVRATATGARVITTDRELGTAEAADLVAGLEADPAVEYAEPDLLMKPAAAAPNDTHYGFQWDLRDSPYGMNVPGAGTAPAARA